MQKRVTIAVGCLKNRDVYRGDTMLMCYTCTRPNYSLREYLYWCIPRKKETKNSKQSTEPWLALTVMRSEIGLSIGIFCLNILSFKHLQMTTAINVTVQLFLLLFPSAETGDSLQKTTWRKHLNISNVWICKITKCFKICLFVHLYYLVHPSYNSTWTSTILDQSGFENTTVLADLESHTPDCMSLPTLAHSEIAAGQGGWLMPKQISRMSALYHKVTGAPVQK